MSENGTGKDLEAGVHGGLPRQLTTVTLSPEQFEALYLQPRTASGVASTLAHRTGNPTPIGVVSFLIAQVPLALYGLGFQGTSTATATIVVGALFGAAGVGLFLASIMEWYIGNTLPSTVFAAFAGFFISYGFLVSPIQEVAASFAPLNSTATSAGAIALAGESTRAFNSGLGLYFVVWAIIAFLFMIPALRTNVPFFLTFLSLVFTFSLFAAGYFQQGMGNLARASHLFKVAGGFNLIVSISGFWTLAHLLLASVDFPFNVPVFDLSHIVPGRTPRLRTD